MKDTVTLYIATHNVTGKKYFGKTEKYFTEEDLQKNYHGSGKYWTRHLKKHGNKDVTMEIYQICSLNESDDDYVKPIALKFSEENNIVESDEWANLKDEDGLVGGTSKGIKNPNFGVLKTEEHKEKIRQKSLLQRHSEETKENMRKPKPKICCLNCKREISVNNFPRHIEPCLIPKIIKEYVGFAKENNPRALKIDIYNSEGNKVYECRGDFVALCKSDGLPYIPLTESYKNGGSKIFQNLNNHQLSKYTKNGKLKYKDWFALLID